MKGDSMKITIVKIEKHECLWSIDNYRGFGVFYTSEDYKALVGFPIAVFRENEKTRVRFSDKQKVFNFSKDIDFSKLDKSEILSELIKRKYAIWKWVRTLGEVIKIDLGKERI